MPKAEARLRRRRVRVRQALREQLVPARQLPWSRLYGNYSGLSQSDENGRTSPNVGRAFDYPMMMFDQHGKPVYGPLATDRPHQFKAQFIYQLPFGTTIGANEYVASGLPVTRELGILPTSNYPVQYLGRGATAARRCSRRPTCTCSTRSSSAAPSSCSSAERAEPVQPGCGDQRFVDVAEVGKGIKFDESCFLRRQGGLRPADRRTASRIRGSCRTTRSRRRSRPASASSSSSSVNDARPPGLAPAAAEHDSAPHAITACGAFFVV